MKIKYMLMVMSAATANAFAGTPYVAPAPESAPAPSDCRWFLGGSFGQFDVDNNLDSVANDASLLDIAISLGADSVEDIEDSDFLNDLEENEFEALEDAFDELIDSEQSIEDFLSETTLGDFNNALADGYALETEVSDVELDMYTLHFGRELGTYSGFDLSAYLEIGWLTGDMTLGLDYVTPDNSYNVFEESLDIDVIPLTANFKVEHVIYGPVGGYLSGGLGYAWTRIDSDGLDIDESDGGFYAQAAAGLVWNVNDSFGLFGGARWVYLEGLDFGDSGFELEDTFGWEIGARYKF